MIRLTGLPDYTKRKLFTQKRINFKGCFFQTLPTQNQYFHGIRASVNPVCASRSEFHFQKIGGIAIDII